MKVRLLLIGIVLMCTHLKAKAYTPIVTLDSINRFAAHLPSEVPEYFISDKDIYSDIRMYSDIKMYSAMIDAFATGGSPLEKYKFKNDLRKIESVSDPKALIDEVLRLNEVVYGPEFIIIKLHHGYLLKFIRRHNYYVDEFDEILNDEPPYRFEFDIVLDNDRRVVFFSGEVSHSSARDAGYTFMAVPTSLSQPLRDSSDDILTCSFSKEPSNHGFCGYEDDDD